MEEAIWGLADAFSGRLKIEFHSVMHVTELTCKCSYTWDMTLTTIGFPEEPNNARKSHNKVSDARSTNFGPKGGRIS